MLLVVAMSSTAQNVTVFMQDVPTGNSSLYWDAKYGMKTMAKDWEMLNDSTFNYKGHTITVRRFSEDDWCTKGTPEFIDLLKHGENDMLYVYVGHNCFMDYDYVKDTIRPTSQNMLFGCVTENWPISSSYLQTTNLIAPERYITVTGIQMWLDGKYGNDIRKHVAYNYAHYQHIPLDDAADIFQVLCE